MVTENLKNVSPKDGFVVVQESGPSDKELHGLLDLYVPIMGSNAYGLYVLLSRYGKPRPDLVKRSMNKELLVGLSLGMRDFLEVREKLEALGLLRTFEKNDRLGKLSLYFIQRPLVGENFFNDDLLSTLLLETIGQGAFRKLQEKYCPPKFNIEGSTEVTKSFLDVFPIRQSALMKSAASKQVQPLEKKQQQLIDQNETDLDVKFFRQLLERSFVPEEEVFKNMDAVQTIHLLYGLDEMQLVRLLEEAIDISSNKLNVKYFKMLAHNSFDYQMKTTSSAKGAAFSPQAENTSTSSDPADAQLLEFCRSLAPMEFLQAIKDETGALLTSSEKYMVSNLVQQQILPNEVINVLIHYILSDRGNASMNQNYFETTAATWSKNGVKTAEQAMSEVRKVVQEGAKKHQKYGNKKKNYRQGRAVVQKEQLPEWAQNDYKQPETTKDQSSKKADLQAQIKRRLAEIKNDN
ncbi:chromosome replication initiation membrane attachment protein [Ligilactobacillus acidipiscis DSM 15836]|uniref:Chromosome replication initiation membrane attachment protein n=2 Tax=Ligilactobacillus acidipiscis TaxID=89059 RepID=A0A0R2K848_9LACO|nr:DnaD domain protein [Ligilactobacillus acidipiscis]KRM30285.1 chromosome replication initiation membrane attachment protein [Ligilactobacillus acidipiscis DSM 15836]KRN85683.1 chromosome replication initiation membrane attachment protein [Ligilactobacillus acidipiscis]SFV40394.1 Helicase loader DnaB [Ligilactobacillus acidipiscis]GAW63903.1 replicative DNA helicase [Ligilactobacillus acidipiscis]GEN20625.1 helicase DnaB [Ligilactobacillus acidipiscis]